MPDEPSLHPGARIRARREERDISTCDLAKRVGRAEGSIRNIENGRAIPGRRLLGRICRELNLPFGVFDEEYTALAAEKRERERKAEPTAPPKRQDKESTTHPKRAAGVAA